MINFIFKVSLIYVPAFWVNSPVYYCICLYLHICYFCVTAFCIQSWALRSQQSLSNIPQANLALGACPTNHCTICIHICAFVYSHFVFRFLDFPHFCFWYLCTSQKLSLSDWHCKFNLKTKSISVFYIYFCKVMLTHANFNVILNFCVWPFNCRPGERSLLQFIAFPLTYSCITQLYL